MTSTEVVSNPFAALFDQVDQADIPNWQPGEGRPDVDYPHFRQLPKPRTPADQVLRYNEIRRQFPSITFGTAEWRRVLDERPAIFKELLRLLAEHDAMQELRPNQGGRRPATDHADGHRRLMRMFGLEFSLLPFAQSFTVLCQGRSIRSVARRTGLTSSQVHRYKSGAIEPSGADMEAVAKAFGVHPSYFIEWRTAYVVSAIHARMAGHPETSMHLYNHLTRS